MNSLSTIAQIASAATNLLLVLVIAVGYYVMIKVYRQMVAVYGPRPPSRGSWATTSRSPTPCW